MKKLSFYSALLVLYVFLFVKSNFAGVNVFASIFFYLSVSIAIFLIAEALHGLFKTNGEKRKNSRLLLLTLFFSIFLLEMFLRYGMAKYGNYLEKNTGKYGSLYENNNDGWYHLRYPGIVFVEDKVEFKYAYRINSEGLADREHPLAKAQGEFRIVALGDSFTEGIGAAPGSSWPEMVEKSFILKKSGKKVSMIKAGVSASDLFFEYVLLKNKLLKYRPDLVIVAINNSDLTDVRIRGGMERFQANGKVVIKKGPAWEWLYSLSFIFRHIVHDVLHYDMELQKQSGREERNKATLNLLYSGILMFAELAGEKDFALLIVFHPIREEIIQKRFDLSSLVEKLGSETAIQVLDLFKFYLEKEKVTASNSSRYYWQIDGHHNAAGYAAFARGVEWKLEQMGIPN